MPPAGQKLMHNCKECLRGKHVMGAYKIKRIKENRLGEDVNANIVFDIHACKFKTLILSSSQSNNLIK